MDSLAAALHNNSSSASGSEMTSGQHADPIELSNACRAFYQARLESARALKEKWGPSLSASSSCAPGAPSRRGDDTVPEAGEVNEQNSCYGGDCGGDSGGDGGDSSGGDGGGNTVNSCRRKKSSIDVAMETLREEMSSLMEQDLCLMRQLLTLNEEIEELKWRRRYCWTSRGSSMMTSSADVDMGSMASFTSSEASLAWGWRGESGDLLALKYPGISSLSLQAGEHNRLSVYDEDDPMGTFNSRRAGASSSSARLSRLGSLKALAVAGGGGQSHFQHQNHHHYHQQQHQLQQQQQQQQKQQQQQSETTSLTTTTTPTTTTTTTTSKGSMQSKSDSSGFAERESFDSGIHEGYVDSSTSSSSSSSSASASASAPRAVSNSSTNVTQS